MSRIVAEVISAAIDELCPSINRKGRAIRHVDDIWMGAETESKAQALLSEYREALRRFELDLSEPKTRICRSSELTDDGWPSEISRRVALLNPTRWGGSEASELDEVSDLITFTLKTAHHAQDDGVVKYLIRKVDTKRRWGKRQRWALFERFLMVSALNFPHSIDYVARIVAWKARIGHTVDKRAWVRICNEIIADSARLRYDSEVCWATWLIRELGGRLNKGAFEETIRFASSTACLAAMMLRADGKVAGTPNLDGVRNRFSLESPVGKNWLFVHECLVRGWVAAADFDMSQDHPFLEQMRAANVRFMDENALPGVFSPADDDPLGENAFPEMGIEEHLGGYDDDIDDDQDFDDNQEDHPF